MLRRNLTIGLSLWVALYACATGSRDHPAGGIGITDSVAVSTILSHVVTISNQPLDEELRGIAEPLRLPVHADPRPLSPSYDPMIMLEPNPRDWEGEIEKVGSNDVEVRGRAIAALGVPLSDAIEDLRCAWGGLIPRDEEYFRNRERAGCHRITERRTVIMTRPQKHLVAEIEFEDEIVAALADGRAVVVRALIIDAGPVWGSTSTDDFVIGRNAKGKPTILATRGLLVTD